MLKKTIKTSLVLTLILSILVSGCRFSNILSKNESKIPKDIRELCYIEGDINSDTVIINAQGGPDTKLSKEEYNLIKKEQIDKKIMMVNVEQVQTRNPEKFLDEEIPFEKAIQYDEESVEYLYKVVEYFKEQGKKIHIIGASFGAFIVQELIFERGVNIADNIILAVGRLDINEETWENFSRGDGGMFINGEVFVSEDIEDEPLSKNMSKLAAGLSYNRYTKKLKNHDLSKVTYIYSKDDESVGRLTNKEIKFLKSKNVNVIAVEGGHEAGYAKIPKVVTKLLSNKK
ncbi:hypothetical protein PV797_16500 [Clostridiaceae bacterium M8S5]|nr:hypothetical protein PV797_16500 [Clostridiaceae bacterium M8S5]